jgi:arylsulfatase A-like enzyme
VAYLMPETKALVVVMDAARRQEAHQAFGASSMPALAEAATGTLIAPSCWTVPSVASMLTGLYPPEHGMSWPLEGACCNAPSLAHLLPRAGRSFKLLSGNHIYAPPLIEFPDQCMEMSKWHRSRPASFLGRTLSVMDYGSRSILHSIEEMAADRQLPDLLMVHLQEAHHPYLTPASGAAPLKRLRYGLGHLAYYFTKRAQAWEFAANADEQAWRRQRADYLDCLNYVTGILEDILRAYDRAGVLEDTFVVITADHGEHLGEHGLADHQGSLHEELVNCPCAMISPTFEPGAVIPGQFQHTDLLTTLCDYLEVPTDGYRPAWEPLNMLDPANHPEGHRYAFTQWRSWGEAKLRKLQQRNPSYDFGPLNRDLVGVRSKRWKYIQGSDGSEQLYDLQADPGEQRDISDEEPQVVGTLTDALTTWLSAVTEDGPHASAGRYAAGEQQVVEKRLKDLGYI